MCFLKTTGQFRNLPRKLFFSISIFSHAELAAEKSTTYTKADTLRADKEQLSLLSN